MTDCERLKELIEKLIRGKEIMDRYDWEELTPLLPHVFHCVNNHDPMVQVLETVLAAQFECCGEESPCNRTFCDWCHVCIKMQKTLATAKGEPE